MFPQVKLVREYLPVWAKNTGPAGGCLDALSLVLNPWRVVGLCTRIGCGIQGFILRTFVRRRGIGVPAVGPTQ